MPVRPMARSSAQSKHIDKRNEAPRITSHRHQFHCHLISPTAVLCPQHHGQRSEAGPSPTHLQDLSTHKGLKGRHLLQISFGRPPERVLQVPDQTLPSTNCENRFTALSTSPFLNCSSMGGQPSLQVLWLPLPAACSAIGKRSFGFLCLSNSCPAPAFGTFGLILPVTQ